MMIVWDLDGTLINTREAHRRAYMEIGVEPPIGFHKRPWQEWCDSRDHERKDDIVVKLLPMMAMATPLMSMYRQLGGIILTNTSKRTASLLSGLYGLGDVRAEMTPDLKFDYLYLRNNKGGGVYFDDNLDLVERVRRELTHWRSAHVQF